MIKVEIIGNLGATAELKSVNGDKFISFRVAHSTKRTVKETGEILEDTIWVSCTLNGDGGKLLPYLLKGQKVYIRGSLTTKIYTSPKDHQPHVGLNCRVQEVELCGGNAQPKSEQPAEGNDVPF